MSDDNVSRIILFDRENRGREMDEDIGGRGWMGHFTLSTSAVLVAVVGVNKLAARFRGSLLIQLYFSQGALLPDHVQPLVSADGVTVFSRLLRIQGAGQSRETRNDTGAQNQISVAGL